MQADSLSSEPPGKPTIKRWILIIISLYTSGTEVQKDSGTSLRGALIIHYGLWIQTKVVGFRAHAPSHGTCRRSAVYDHKCSSRQNWSWGVYGTEGNMPSSEAESLFSCSPLSLVNIWTLVLLILLIFKARQNLGIYANFLNLQILDTIQIS